MNQKVKTETESKFNILIERLSDGSIPQFVVGVLKNITTGKYIHNLIIGMCNINCCTF